MVVSTGKLIKSRIPCDGPLSMSARVVFFSCNFYYEHLACVFISNDLPLDKLALTIHKVSTADAFVIKLVT